MFERYTEKARRVVFFARHEASAAGVPYIDDEHVLLGLIRESRGQLARFLGSLDVVQAVERETREHMTKTENTVPTNVDLPLSRSCQQALRAAAQEATFVRHDQVGTEHLLLGLLRQSDTLVTHIITKNGLSLAKARDIVGSGSESEPKPGLDRDAAQRSRIDKPGTVEFVDSANDSFLAKSELELLRQVPRIGEEVVLITANAKRAYRVRDVTYAYEQTATEPVGSAVKLAKIVIRVEPAGSVRAAQWDAMT